jgi:hypothetical protein
MEDVGNFTPCPLYPQEPRQPFNMRRGGVLVRLGGVPVRPGGVPVRLGGVPEPGWTVLKKRKTLASVGIRAPDRPVRGKSLHPLSYPAPLVDSS